MKKNALITLYILLLLVEANSSVCAGEPNKKTNAIVIKEKTTITTSDKNKHDNKKEVKVQKEVVDIDYFDIQETNDAGMRSEFNSIMHRNAIMNHRRWSIGLRKYL